MLATTGASFFIVTFIIYLLIDLEDLVNITTSYIISKIPLSETDSWLTLWALTSVAVSLVVGFIISIFYSLRPSVRAEMILENIRDNELHYTILKNVYSISKGQWEYLQFVLKSGKVYVGVCTLVTTKSDLDSFSICPVLSGYRSKEKHELVFTTNYFDFYTKTDLEEKEIMSQYRIILLREEIQFISTFDPDAYNKFNPIPLTARPKPYES